MAGPDPLRSPPPHQLRHDYYGAPPLSPHVTCPPPSINPTPLLYFDPNGPPLPLHRPSQPPHHLRHDYYAPPPPPHVTCPPPYFDPSPLPYFDSYRPPSPLHRPPPSPRHVTCPPPYFYPCGPPSPSTAVLIMQL